MRCSVYSFNIVVFRSGGVGAQDQGGDLAALSPQGHPLVRPQRPAAGTWRSVVLSSVFFSIGQFLCGCERIVLHLITHTEKNISMTKIILWKCKDFFYMPCFTHYSFVVCVCVCASVYRYIIVWTFHLWQKPSLDSFRSNLKTFLFPKQQTCHVFHHVLSSSSPCYKHRLAVN